MEALIVVLLPIGCILLLFGLFSGNERAPFNRRMETVKSRNQVHGTNEAQVSISRQKNKNSEIAFLNTLIENAFPRQDMLRLRIDRAGMSFSIGIYVLTGLLIAVTMGLVSSTLSGAPATIAILSGITAGLSFPHIFLGWMIKRRQIRFIEYFPDAIDLMVRGLKAGLPIGESIKTAGQEIPDPVGVEMRRVTDGIRIGRKMDDILAEAAQRVNLQEFDFFTIALSIQAETGGNLAETLGNLTDVLRGRRQIKRKIKALSSEAKASAYIIGSLPFIMTLLIYLLSPEYLIGLFNDPRGQAMVAFGLFMIFAGVGVMMKMVKFEI